MAIRNFPAHRQPDPRAFVFGAAVEPLKDDENLVGELLLEADAVVAHRDLADALARLRAGDRNLRELDDAPGNLYQRAFAGLVKFERVADEVLKELPHLQRIGVDRRQRAHFDLRALVFDRHFEIGQHFRENPAQIARRERLRAAGHARELEQILDQHLHALRGVVHAREIVEPLLAELRGALRLEPVAEGLDFSQWLLEVVRRHAREVLQLRVRALELRREAHELFLRRLSLADVRTDAHEPDDPPVRVAQRHLARLQPVLAVRPLDELLAIQNRLPALDHGPVVTDDLFRERLGKIIEHRAPLDALLLGEPEVAAVRRVVEDEAALRVF